MANEINVGKIKTLSTELRSDILHMTYLANSGHIGGPLGFVETFLVMLEHMDLDKSNPYNIKNNKLVLSAGHYSALVYSALANIFYPKEHDLIISNFRTLNDVVEGHVTHHFPFIWDSTGHLGYGPSIAAGHAIADKLFGNNNTRIFCTMGDGEQTEGTIAESLRSIKKYDLPVTIIIDCNKQQLSGSTNKVMPMNVSGTYEANDWKVYSVDGYDFDKLNNLFSQIHKNKQNVILVDTIMGKGVSEAEGTHKYHGKPVSDFEKAISELGSKNKLELYKKLRDSTEVTGLSGRPIFKTNIDVGKRTVYSNNLVDCRSAWGSALVNMGEINIDENGKPKNAKSPIAVFDCDLAGCVKTEEFGKKFPNNFFRLGIQEHSTAMTAGTVSARGVSTWLAMFGAFGHTLCYNEMMLTSMNQGNLKLVTTHNSIDTGMDSKTHSPINYLALKNHRGWKTFVPADANQTDALVRYMASEYGNMHIALGRSKISIITKQDSETPFFDENYKLNIDKGYDVLRDYGNDYIIITYGTPTFRAINASQELLKKGIKGKLINCYSPTQISDKLAEEISKSKTLVTFEDHNVETGIMFYLSPVLLRKKVYPDKIKNVGMESYSKSDSSDKLYAYFGIDENNLIEAITKIVKK